MVELSHHPGWAEVLKPWLEDKITNSWPDPKGFKSNEEFVYAYNIAHGWAEAANGVIAFVKQKQDQVTYLRKKKAGEITDKFKAMFRKGGEENVNKISSS